MGNLEYSPEAAKTIRDKLNAKGWNVYKRISGAGSIPIEVIINRGPADELEVLESYVIFPVTQKPYDSTQVFRALVETADEKFKIEINGRAYKFEEFTLNQHNVKIRAPEGLYVLYPDFIKALDTIVDARQ